MRDSRLPRPLVAGVLFVTLATAAWLRLGSLDVILFSHDEAEWSNAALSIARGEYFPLVGITSLVAVNTGPAFLYLLALPMLFSTDPSFVTGFVGLLNLAAVALVFPFTKRYFGTGPALAATILYAAGPWAVYHSRKIWNPNALPLFALLFYWALFRVAVDRQPRYLLLAAGSCAVAIQLNQAGLLLLPVLSGFVLVFWRRIGVRTAAASVGVGFLIMSPYLYHEITHGWADLWQAASVASGRAEVDAEAARLALAVVAGWGFPGDIFGIWTRAGETVPDFWPSSLFVSAMLVLGLAALGRQLAFARGDRVKSILVLLWVVLPPLALTRHGFEMHIRYLLTVQPGGFVAAGIGVGLLIESLARLLTRVGVRRATSLAIAAGLVPVALVACLQTVDYREVLHLIDRNGLEQSYGIPLRFYREATAVAGRLRGEGQYSAVVFRTPTGMVQPLRYLARISGLDVRQSSERDALVLPDTGSEALLVDAYSHQEPDQRLLGLGLMELTAERVEVLGGQNSFRFFQVPAQVRTEAQSALASGRPEVRLDNGLRLAAYENRLVGNRLLLKAAWSLWQTPQPLNGDPTLCLAQHVVDDGGTALAVKDVPTESSSNLRRGDVLLTWSDVVLPRDLSRQQAWLEVSIYGCWKRQFATFVSADGKSVGSWRLNPVGVGTPVSLLQASPAARSAVMLGDSIRLLGYDVRDDGADSLKVGLYWSTANPVKTNYTVFVQLLGKEGPLAQSDAMPSGGKFPTSLWDVDELVLDEHRLSLPTGLTAGEYRLIAGMYDLSTMKRLPVGDGLTGAGDLVELGTVRVEPGAPARFSAVAGR